MDLRSKYKSSGSGGEEKPKFHEASSTSERSSRKKRKPTLKATTSQAWDEPSTSKQADRREKIGKSTAGATTSQASEKPLTSKQADEIPSEFYFSYAWTTQEKTTFCKGVVVKSEVIDDDEQEVILNEAADNIAHLPRVEAEIDFVTEGHREAEIKDWTEASMKIIHNIVQRAWGEYKLVDPTMTVLDLPSSTFILPHKECRRCRGDIFVYINLLGTVILRLLSKKDARKIVDIYLTSRSVLFLKKEVQKGYIRQMLTKSNRKFNNITYLKTHHVAILISDEDKNKKKDESCKKK